MNEQENNNQWKNIDIIKEVMSISWIYEKVFWKLLKWLVYDKLFMNTKHILETAYWFNDTHIFFEQIDRKEFTNISKIIFKFYWEQKTSFIEKVTK